MSFALSALVGIIVGVIVTILVSRYYFRRSTRKSLKSYLVLNTRVFAGIDQEVRHDLHFSFRGEEVRELQHLEFLIANDGERAVSNLIEPLRLTFPTGQRILDASVLFKSPQSLQIELRTELTADALPILVMTFPLLNKREYFLVKVLVGGFVPRGDLAFTVLADDLPRSLKPEWLPSDALQERPPRFEWGVVVAGLFVWVLAWAVGHTLYTVRDLRPELFPVPWHSFHLTVTALPLAIAIVVDVLLAIIGAVLIASGFGSALPGKPHFPLPRELRRHGHFFGFGFPYYANPTDFDYTAETGDSEHNRRGTLA